MPIKCLGAYNLSTPNQQCTILVFTNLNISGATVQKEDKKTDINISVPPLAELELEVSRVKIQR